jgi:hypothetical protein
MRPFGWNSYRSQIDFLYVAFWPKGDAATIPIRRDRLFRANIQTRRRSDARAAVLTNRIQRFSPLKAWAVRPAARKGFKKATVAAARKIAAPMARRNHLRLDQRGDAGITE